MSKNIGDKFSVLMELRTALMGYSGISQETRLLFSAFQDFERTSAVGLISSNLEYLAKGLPLNWRDRKLSALQKYNRLSNLLLSINDRRSLTSNQKVIRYLLRRYKSVWLALRARMNIKLPLNAFEAGAFEDCVWEEFFSKSLPITEWDRVVKAEFRALTTPFVLMQYAGLLPGGDFPMIDTKGFDALLCPNPYPGRPTPGTKLVIRYHDAIPMYYPQFIPDTKFHQKSHAVALKSNAKDGYFICTTDAVRRDLLQMFPEVEPRSCTIHDMVSHNYYAQPAHMRQVCEIVRAKVSVGTEPVFDTRQEKQDFYKKHVDKDKFSYLIYVSIIDPRKNHQRLLRAFDILQERGFESLKLVIVGNIGQSVEKVLSAMRRLQRQGQLFHLTDVSSDELRVLYSGAECTVCPSITEGFDLSGIEAMLSGGVVVTSDIAVHREVYGDASVYFNMYSITDQAKAIESMIHPDSREFREDMRRKGSLHARQYSRDRIAPKWERFFERLKEGSSIQ